MDTNDAIAMIQGLMKNAQDSLTATQAQLDGFTVILGILQGTLQTELTKLTPDEITALQASAGIANGQ